MKRMTATHKHTVGVLCGLGVMIGMTAALLYGSMQWHRATYERYLTVHEISWQTVEREAVALPTFARQYGIRALYRGLDADGKAVSYIAESVTEGFHKGSEIVIESEFSSAGDLLARMTVLAQNEDKYYGDRIMLPSFSQRFAGRAMPLLLPAESGKGSRIDAISGATGSSVAVIRSVNKAYEFLQQWLTDVNAG